MTVTPASAPTDSLQRPAPPPLTTTPGWMADTAIEAEHRLRAEGIHLTLGGEPTYVPLKPEGAEWSVTADGPTKLGYAHALAAEIQRRTWPGSTLMYCPGKRYDGEVNPRWALRLITGLDGLPVVRWPQDAAAGRPPEFGAPGSMPPLPRKGAKAFLKAVGMALGCVFTPLKLKDPLAPDNRVWAVPLCHHAEATEEGDPEGWQAAEWNLAKRRCLLLPASGPAGLRLPLEHFPEGVLRQVLTLEIRADSWNLFLPPLAREPLHQLLKVIAAASEGWSQPELSGMLPVDVDGQWQVLGLTADPGVLEVNLPVCHGWADYAGWMQTLAEAGAAVGLCSSKGEGLEQQGTGGGNHLLWGGASLDANPFFSRPTWLVAILRFWQHHPSLAYLFSNNSVGPSSQAPRLDEGSASALDLRLAHSALEQLPEGDQRVLVSETLRHLHADRSGNTHRSEISFDKFWNPAWPSGCQGLIEFRAIEALPKAEWAAAIALLWSALAAHLLDPVHRPTALRAFGEQLHDEALLPHALWSDLQRVLQQLDADGLDMQPEPYRQIWNWRFPLLLSWERHGARLEIRRALEPWPLLCDTPAEGGTTSRFVDSSLQRLELRVNEAFLDAHRLRLCGRDLPLGDGWLGIRYRHSSLFPSLHPCIANQLPLQLEILAGGSGERLACFRRDAEPHEFVRDSEPIAPLEAPPWPVPATGLRTIDLRLG